MRTAGLLFVALTWCFLLYSCATPIIEENGTSHYAMTKSLVRDGDFTLTHDPILWERNSLRWYPGSGSRNQTAAVSPGTAYCHYYFLKYLPNTWIVQRLAGNLSNYNSSTPQSDAAAILLANIFWGVLLIFVIFRLLFERYNASLSMFSIFTVFLGTPLLFFTLISPGSSVVIETFCLALALKLLDRARSDEIYKPELYIFLSGLVSGWLLLSNNLMFPVILVLGFAGMFVTRVGDSRFVIRFLRVFIFGLGLTPFVIAQFIHNSRYYDFWTNFGFAPFFKFNFDLSLLGHLLFPSKGIFLWFPIFLLALTGIIWIGWKDKWLSFTALFIVIGYLVSCQFAPDVQIDSVFGLGSMAVLAPVMALGISELLGKRNIGITTILVFCTLFSYIFVGLVMALTHSDPPMRTEFTNYSVFGKNLSEMKKKSLYSPFSLISHTLRHGAVPAVGPNLFHSLTMPDTVFVTGLAGNFDPHDPDVLRGSLKIWSRGSNRMTVTFELWPFLEKDENYKVGTRMASFEVPATVRKGFQTIHWRFNQLGSLHLDIPGYEGQASASRIHWRGTTREFLLQAHVKITVGSGGSSRFYQTDVERLLK